MSDLGIASEERKKYFILSPGRTGSSLLSSFLADAGARFVAEHKESWNPLAGAFEDEAFDHMAFLLSQAHYLEVEKRFTPLYKLSYKKIVTLKRFLAKRKMRRIFSKSSYFKGGNPHHSVQLSAHLGYWPVVIVNCRPYDTWMGSMYPGQRNHTVESLTANYVTCLKNSLALLGLFGGCVVDYKEIMDTEERLWAENLGKVTGLDADAILESRRKRLGKPGPETALPVRNAEAAQIYDYIQEYASQVVPPSPAAARRWLA